MKKTPPNVAGLERRRSPFPLPSMWDIKPDLSPCDGCAVPSLSLLTTGHAGRSLLDRFGFCGVPTVVWLKGNNFGPPSKTTGLQYLTLESPMDCGDVAMPSFAPVDSVFHSQ